MESEQPPMDNSGSGKPLFRYFATVPETCLGPHRGEGDQPPRRRGHEGVCGGVMADPDLRVLARFLPEFERANFSPGDWSEMQKQEDGVYTMPYATLSPAASEFVKAAYDGGWVLQDFNWPESKDTEEAIALYRDPDLLARARLANSRNCLRSSGAPRNSLRPAKFIGTLRSSNDIPHRRYLHRVQLAAEGHRGCVPSPPV
jgi:hypothetical protein